MAKTLSDSTIIEEVRKNLDEIGLNDSLFDTDNGITDASDTPRDETDLDTIIKQKIAESYRFILEKAPVERLSGEMIVEKEAKEIVSTSEEGTVVADGELTIEDVIYSYDSKPHQVKKGNTIKVDCSKEYNLVVISATSKTVLASAGVEEPLDYTVEADDTVWLGYGTMSPADNCSYIITRNDGTRFTGMVTIATPFRFVYGISSDWPYPVYEPIMWNEPEYATLLCSYTTGTKDRPKIGIVPSMTKGHYDVTFYGATTDAKVGYIDLTVSYDSGITQLEDSLYSSMLYYITSLVLLTLRDEQHAENMVAQAMALLGIDPSRQTQQ